MQHTDLDVTFPLISIVLPTYNGATYLAEAITSCIAQTYTHWELWIIYDYSNDATLEIIQHYAASDKRIHYAINQHGHRLPGALNTGFARTTGAYLTWLSDDNCFLPHALATLATTLTTQPTIDFVYSDYTIVDDGGQTIDYYTVAPSDQFIVGHHYLQSFLYRRHVYETVGPYAEDLFLAEDFDYWLRVYANGHRMLPIHQSLYQYRRHGQSLSSQQKQQVLPVTTKVLYRYLRDYPHYRHETGQIFLYLATIASWQGKKQVAAALFLLASLHTPLLAYRRLLSYVQLAR